MLEILKAVLWGIVEGITEWLPISSTGHMILLDELIQLDVTDSFRRCFCSNPVGSNSCCPSVVLPEA